MKKSLKFCKSKTGFTLVELVIVIAIVIILSVISVPIYRGYIDKAKWAEGYALIGTVVSAQKAYYSEYGNFLTWDTSDYYYTSDRDPIFGIDSRGNKYFTRYCVGSNWPKSSFYFHAKKPSDLGDPEKSCLYAEYSINGGIKISESSQNW